MLLFEDEVVVRLFVSPLTSHFQCFKSSLICCWGGRGNGGQMKLQVNYTTKASFLVHSIYTYI